MDRIISIIALSLSSFMLFAQSGFVSTGGSSTGTSGSTTYSVGQLSTKPQESSAAMITPGLQQAFEISEVVSTDDHVLPYSVSIYPNPASDHLWIDVEDDQNHQNLDYSIYTSDGRLISSSQLTSNHHELDISLLSNGIYILHLSNDIQQKRSFRMVKN